MGVQHDGDLMFSVKCNEPEGSIERKVYKVEFTPENLQKIYNKAAKFRTIMGWEIPTYEHFITFFVTPEGTGFKSRGLCARVDDYIGLFWLTDINYSHPPFDATIHYTFFDRRHKGRLELCREAIRYTFDTYGFERLSTLVPLYVAKKRDESVQVDEKDQRWSVMNFVERIGFIKEGRLKNKMMYKGTLYDANLYALTKSDMQDAFKNADLKNSGSKKQWAPEIQTIEHKSTEA